MSGRGVPERRRRGRHAFVLLAAIVPALAWPQSAGSAGSTAPADSATAAGIAEPLSAAEAAPYMRQLTRELRVLVRDTPIEVDALRGDALLLRIPAAWLFEVDAVALRPEAQVRLDALGLALVSPQGERTRVEVVGHSDSLGRREPNEAFTQRRAEAVAALLAARGVAPARLATRGAGEAELREKKEDSPAARQRNRRIEIEIRPSRPSRREAS